MPAKPPSATGARGRQQWPSDVSHSEVPTFGDPAHEYEKFSPDTAWMPGAVLIAKSTYVWLAQLSRQYGRHIGRLDQIPDEELATLAARGINALWLIGVWERSRASQIIKQLCGNPEAVASAYSLFDYAIADDLGGEAAYIDLRDRAAHRGIRLASDMVPNHMGIDSPWVIEHPELVHSRPNRLIPPTASRGRISRTTAASRSRSKTTTTSRPTPPWSFAAVTKPAERRATSITATTAPAFRGTIPRSSTTSIPKCASRSFRPSCTSRGYFPVIRFDAAMTLAKQHYQRLWFPEPGTAARFRRAPNTA